LDEITRKILNTIIRIFLDRFPFFIAGISQGIYYYRTLRERNLHNRVIKFLIFSSGKGEEQIPSGVPENRGKIRILHV